MHPHVHSHDQRSGASAERAGRGSRIIGFWHLWIVLFLLALIAGTRGYYFYLKDLHPEVEINAWRHLLNSFYYAAQLFALHSGFYKDFFMHPVGLDLEIARYLAAIVAYGAVFQAVMLLIRRTVAEFGALSSRGHHIICGLGAWSLQLAQDLVADRRRLVVIEKDPANEFVATARSSRIRVIMGDARDAAILRRAGIVHADTLVAFSGEDGTNVAIAVEAEGILQAQRDRGRLARVWHAATQPLRRLRAKLFGERQPLRSFVHIVDLSLREAFEQGGVFSQTPERLGDVRLFNSFENAVRGPIEEMCTSIPALGCAERASRADDPQGMHLIILGFGQMGQSMALQAVRMGHFTEGCRLQITVVDPDTQAISSFRSRYLNPEIELLCPFTSESAEFHDATGRRVLENALAAQRTKTYVAVCVDDDRRAMETALSLPRGYARDGIPVYVWLSEPSGPARLFQEDREKLPPSLRHLRPFGLPSECASPDAVFRPEVETLARAIHDAYRAERTRQELTGTPQREEDHEQLMQDTLPASEAIDAVVQRHPDLWRDDPSMRPWESLPEYMKSSNYQQADHLPIKLSLVGCYAAKEKRHALDWQLHEFTRTETELLAQVEHRRWCAERWIAGWVYGDPPNKDLKVSRSLVPWDELDRGTREYDLNAVRVTAGSLARVGKAVFRRSPSGS